MLTMFEKSRDLLNDLSEKIKSSDAIVDEKFGEILDLALEVDSQVRKEIEADLDDNAYTVLRSVGYNEFLKISIRKLNRSVKTVEDGFDGIIALRDGIFSEVDDNYETFVKPFRKYILKIVHNFIDVVNDEILDTIEENTSPEE